jgi:threonine dehydrogenase-like Zn-dependent dehydrogenase
VLDVLRVQGTSVVVGSYKKPPEVDLLKVEFKELTMVGIRVYEPRDFDIAIRLLESEFVDFDLLFTESAPDKAPAVFQDLLKGADAIKVLFKM